MTRRTFLTTALLTSGITLLPKNIFALQNEDTSPYTFIGNDTFEALITKAQNQKWHLMPLGDLICRIGMSFIKTPYLANSLEKHPEQVIVNLNGMDCVTFVENSLNIARQIKAQRYDIATLIENTQQTRYRNGHLDDYASRLHYTADWMYDNVKKGTWKDVTKELGGVEHKFNFGFMSRNYKKYPMLKDDTTKTLLEKIKATEHELNNRTHYIIPNANIKKAQRNIEDGDIVTIAISTDGLDYGHLGIAFNKQLLHASSVKKEIVVELSIDKYIETYKNNIGISVLRPI